MLKWETRGNFISVHYAPVPNGVLGLETTHCNNSVIHIAIHNSGVYDVLPMTYSAVRALLCR